MAPGQVVDLNDLPPELRQESAQMLSAAPAAAYAVSAPLPAVPPVTLPSSAAVGQVTSWIDQLAQVVDRMLVSPSQGEGGTIYSALTQDFERTLILRALQHTGGRRIEAAQLLGIGRNTITRKIQELKLDEDPPAKLG